MSWSYSGDPSSSAIDEARFMLMDTNEASPIFSDEEIQYLITKYGDNPDMLEYQLFETAATKFAQAVGRTLGPQSEDPSGRLSFYKSRADSAKKKCVSKGLVVTKYQYPKVFWKGMMDNPPAFGRGSFV